jgi:hypothetical protein
MFRKYLHKSNLCQTSKMYCKQIAKYSIHREIEMKQKLLWEQSERDLKIPSSF